MALTTAGGEPAADWLPKTHVQNYRNFSRAFALTNYSEGSKIHKPLSGLLVYRRIMPSAETLSSKFHSCPQNFASRPTVHFSDNLSALGSILRYTSRRRGLFTKYTKTNEKQKSSFILLLRYAFHRCCGSSGIALPCYCTLVLESSFNTEVYSFFIYIYIY